MNHTPIQPEPQEPRPEILDRALWFVDWLVSPWRYGPRVAPTRVRSGISARTVAAAYALGIYGDASSEEVGKMTGVNASLLRQLVAQLKRDLNKEENEQTETKQHTV